MEEEKRKWKGKKEEYWDERDESEVGRGRMDEMIGKGKKREEKSIRERKMGRGVGREEGRRVYK